MKRFILISLPTLFLVTTSFFMKGDNTLGLGKKMPKADLEMDGIDGKAYTLNSLMKPNGLIVVFSCNTCPFVVGSDDFPGWEVQYNDLAKKATEKELGFVLVNSNEAKRENADSMEEMIKRAKEKEYTMPYVVDKGSVVADAFGAKTTPHVFVFNNKRELVYRGAIDDSWDSRRTEDISYLENVIKSIGEGSKLGLNDTPPRGCSIKRVKTTGK